MAGYDYRYIDPKHDQIITDSQTGAIIGIQTTQGQQMIAGISDIASSLGGGLKTISGRVITIPANAQAVVVGGVTISSGSITAIGEFVAINY